MQEERWRPVVGWEGIYEVSSDGNVKRVKRGGKGVRLNPARPFLVKTVNPRGYHVVRLCDLERRHMRSVHGIVLEAFIGPRPPEGQCDHLNEVKTDNRVANLRWVTQKQNMTHTKKTVFATLNGITKSLMEWAEEYGISYQTLHHRFRRHGWPLESALTAPIGTRMKRYERNETSGRFSG